MKYETFIIKTFDQLKNDNFDQVNFGQTTPCRSFIYLTYVRARQKIS
jgi:hypothetical protein